MSDKTEEELYLTAGQTIWLISKVRRNIIQSLLGKKDMIDLDSNTKEIVSRLQDLKNQKKAKKPKTEKKALKGCLLTPMGWLKKELR